MALSAVPVQCAACEMDIASPPVYHLGLAFCCEGCSAGGPCTCTYDEPLGYRDDSDAVDHLGLGFMERPRVAAIEPLAGARASQSIREAAAAAR